MDIRDFPALCTLNDTQLENLRSACDERSCVAGEELITRGDAAGSMFFLLDGDVSVYVRQNGNDVVLADLSAPAVVGELELFTQEPRTASVRAAGPVRLLEIPLDRLQSRIDDGDPAVLKVMFSISRVIAARLARMTDKFVEIERSGRPVRSDELREFRTRLFSEWSFDRVL